MQRVQEVSSADSTPAGAAVPAFAGGARQPAV